MHHLKIAVVGQNGKQRAGRGFSPDEIKEAGIDAGKARELGVRIDRKRKSSHEENVKALQAHLKKAPAKKPAAAAKTKPKK
jgi:large subunit ribosomal protein L13e